MMRLRPIEHGGRDAVVPRLGERLLTPATFRIAILLYFLALFAIRGLLFPGGPNDDSEQLLYSQSLQLGYGLRNPPLYTWMVIGLEQVFGTSLATVVALKFLLLAGTYLCLLEVARMMAADARWAVVAALAPLAMYYVAWDAVLNYSNTVLLLPACTATFYCLLRLERDPRLRWYCAFGLALGIGVMSKYNYLIVAAALFVAASFDASYRCRLLDRWMAVALAIAALVTMPYAVYAYGHADVPGEFGHSLDVDVPASPPYAALLSVWYVITFGFGFLAPLVVLLPLFFWRTCVMPMPETAAQAPAIRLLGRALLIQGLCFLVYFFAVCLDGIGEAQTHAHLFFVFILFPVWFFTRASFVQTDATALARFAAVLAALGLIVPIALPVKFVVDPLVARKAYFNVPYPPLAQALRQAGFHAGTMFTWDLPYPISGNLRLYLPEARVVSGKFPYYAPPPRLSSGQCLAVWGSDDPADVDQQVAMAFGQAFGTPALLDAPAATVELPMVNGWGRTVRFKYRLFPAGVGDCH